MKTTVQPPPTVENSDVFPQLMELGNGMIILVPSKPRHGVIVGTVVASGRTKRQVGYYGTTFDADSFSTFRGKLILEN